jgi:nucleotide-binding universal stress UspA family protein
MNPFEPRHILAATDFSEISTGALRHAVAWARHYRAELTVLHVQEPSPVLGHPFFGGVNLTEDADRTRAATVRYLWEYVKEIVPPDVSVGREVVIGSPAAVIEQFTLAGRGDLVVLGTHGRGGLSRLLLGSVAERTLRMAQHPTLIVHPPPGGEALGAEVPSLRHLLCPVNYSEVARFAFAHAVSVAAAFDARLTAVFVIEEKDVPPPDVQRAEELLRAWLPSKPAPAFEVQAVVRHGDAAEQVLGLAGEAAVDLVVMGAQHRRFVDTTVLGVTTVRVTRHAPCPVLVVPRRGDGPERG